MEEEVCSCFFVLYQVSFVSSLKPKEKLLCCLTKINSTKTKEEERQKEKRGRRKKQKRGQKQEDGRYKTGETRPVRVAKRWGLCDIYAVH